MTDLNGDPDPRVRTITSAASSAIASHVAASDPHGDRAAASAALTGHTAATGAAVHGLGTMSTQAASAVAITGGTLNGVTIGGSTPAKAGSFVVASLPAGAAGMIAFASNGRKNGEGVGAGTGVLVFHDGTAWRACDTGATVAA